MGSIEEESGIEDARNKVTFDSVSEDKSVQDIVGVLDLLLNAQVKYNRKGSGNSNQTAARPIPIKVNLFNPKFWVNQEILKCTRKSSRMS